MNSTVWKPEWIKFELKKMFILNWPSSRTYSYMRVKSNCSLNSFPILLFIIRRVEVLRRKKETWTMTHHCMQQNLEKTLPMSCMQRFSWQSFTLDWQFYVKSEGRRGSPIRPTLVYHWINYFNSLKLRYLTHVWKALLYY